MAGGGRFRIKGGRASKGEAVVEDGALLITGVGAGATTFLALTDTPAVYAGAALQAVRVNGAANALEFVAFPTGGDLQDAYDAAPAVPQITVTAGSPLTIDLASGSADIFTVRDAVNAPVINVEGTFIEVDVPFRPITAFGPVDFENSDGTLGYRFSGRLITGARPELEWIPNGFTQTSSVVPPGAMMNWLSTYVSNVPGGGGFGNDSFGGLVNATGFFTLADKGFVFSTGLLFNMGMTVNMQAACGPIYTLIDQPKLRADGVATTISQHNAVRAQPSYGPHINGGSLTATSVQLFFAFLSNFNTTIVHVDYFVCNAPTISGTGTIGQLDCIQIENIPMTGISTLNGIYSLMNSGTFINHAGIAPSEFSGPIRMAVNVPIWFGSAASNRVEVLRPAAGVLRMIGANGTFDEGLDFDFDFATNVVELSSSTGASLRINLPTTDVQGDLTFRDDGAGLPFGEIYVEDNAVATVIPGSGTWVQVTAFDTNGPSNLTTPDHTNDHITIGHAGIYLIVISASVLSGAGLGATYECEARLNNGATSLPNIHWDRRLAGGGGDVGSTSASGLADLALNDTVEVWVQNKTNGTDVTFEDINLTVVEVGGT